MQTVGVGGAAHKESRENLLTGCTAQASGTFQLLQHDNAHLGGEREGEQIQQHHDEREYEVMACSECAKRENGFQTWDGDKDRLGVTEKEQDADDIPKSRLQSDKQLICPFKVKLQPFFY